MCSFLFANWLIQNLTFANHFLQPRGPDATNVWTGYDFHFVHNLLHMTGQRVLQPFHDPVAHIVALFNGEIYNWHELAEPDENPRTDGDLLISTYLRHAERFAQLMDGEFAVALFDFIRGVAILATDPFGIKPLWFFLGSGGRFAAASYRSGLVRIGAADDDVQRLEPNTITVFDLATIRHKSPRQHRDVDLLVRPRIIRKIATFEFDLRQFKTNTNDWTAAFRRAVQKRVEGPNAVALCFSDGYDSGAISLVLGEMSVPHALYTVHAREELHVLAQRVQHLHHLGVPVDFTLIQLSAEDFASEKTWLGENAERIKYKLREGYTTVDDKAGVGLSWIFHEGATEGRRLFLSGSGADEIISDYGLGGKPLQFHSTLSGIFPESLGDVFPWLNFFAGTQRDYLAKEETAAGARGVESRYPFLDRTLVQEYLWLDAGLKNSAYKAPLQDLMTTAGYPFLRDSKRGFSADKNLIGSDPGDDDQMSMQQLHDLSSLRVTSPGVICANDATLMVKVAVLPQATDTKNNSAGCLLEMSAQDFLSALQPKSIDTQASEHAWLPGSPAISESEACFASSNKRKCVGAGLSESTNDIRNWMAKMANLKPLQSAKEAITQGDMAPPLSIAVANGFTPKHSVAFLTSCMEDNFFSTYCAPLFSSFAEAFGWAGLDSEQIETMQPKHRVFVATAGVSSTLIQKAQMMFPFARFLEFGGEALSKDEDPVAAENYRRVSYQPLKLSQYVRLWQERLLGRAFDYIVCMDSDMLVVKPFGFIFELLAQRRVDVAFTYYDGQREVPWGTTEELARTKHHGYVRLQGGMLLMRNSVEALRWFAQWLALTEDMLHESKGDGPRASRWRDLHGEFKGPSQAALAFLLTRGDVAQMADEGVCCRGVRSVPLHPHPSDNGKDVEVRMMGIPAQYLNDAESTEDGRLLESVHVLHLKGHWWRAVLPSGREDLWAPTRSYEWNREALELWRHHYALSLMGENAQ